MDELGVFTFVGQAATPADAAQEASGAANEWLAYHQWRQADGQPSYKMTCSTQETEAGFVHVIHLYGPVKETESAERRALREQLKQKRDEWFALFESMPAKYFLQHEADRLRELNAEMARLSAAIDGQPVDQDTPPGQVPSFLPKSYTGQTEKLG